MAKNIKIVAFIATISILAGTFLFVGCKKDERIENKSQTIIHQELYKLNSAISSNINIMKYRKESSGFWSKFGNTVGKVCAIAGSDITGAAAGVVATAKISAALGIATGGTGAVAVSVSAGVICGAGASYVTGKAVSKDAESEAKPIVQQDRVIGKRNWDYLNVGEMHNSTLSHFFNSYDCIDINELTTFVLSLNNFIGDNLFYSEEWSFFMQEAMDYANDYVENEFSINQLMDSYLQNGYLTSNIYDVLLSFFDIYLYMENLDDTEYLVDSYVEFVEETDYLSEIEKKALLSAFAVANYSPYYWEQIVDMQYNSDIIELNNDIIFDVCETNVVSIEL